MDEVLSIQQRKFGKVCMVVFIVIGGLMGAETLYILFAAFKARYLEIPLTPPGYEMVPAIAGSLSVGLCIFLLAAAKHLKRRLWSKSSS